MARIKVFNNNKLFFSFELASSNLGKEFILSLEAEILQDQETKTTWKLDGEIPKTEEMIGKVFICYSDLKKYVVTGVYTVSEETKGRFPNRYLNWEESVVKTHEKGVRRYFPLKSKEMKKEAFKQAFEIIFGQSPNQGEVSMAILLHGLDKYIEEFDDKLWVRTIAV